ncbi:hypothetical protein DFQ26_009789 [Actinomortierella ambigua]|nr:hypothetical protein DFQ26_009789 [Actinomortierella ambigua]
MSFQPSNGNTYSQGPGESSSTLRGDALWIRGVNVSSRLMRARSTNMSRQSTLSEVHDLLAFIEDCFPDDEESEIVALLLKADVPEVPEQVISLFAEWALAAASQEYVDFQRMLRGSSLVLEGLAGDLLRMYTSTTALWPNRTQLPFGEDSYIKRSVMPMIDAVFGSLGTVERWRHQLPVPDGYEEVLQPNFYAEVDQLCFAIMEVRKPNAPKADIEDGAHKLPCMMKIALNMLIHQDVQDPTVLGFQVSENTCEVFSMSLKHEAIYIPKSLGRFRIPQDQLDIPGLLLALRPLTAAKESEIVDLLPKADVPEVPEQVISLFAKWAFADPWQEYVDFRRMLRGSSLGLGGLAGDLATMHTATDALWQSRTQQGLNEGTYVLPCCHQARDVAPPSLQALPGFTRRLVRAKTASVYFASRTNDFYRSHLGDLPGPENHYI